MRTGRASRNRSCRKSLTIGQRDLLEKRDFLRLSTHVLPPSEGATYQHTREMQHVTTTFGFRKQSEYIFDSGISLHMLDKKSLTSRRRRQKEKQTTFCVVMTANGLVQV